MGHLLPLVGNLLGFTALALSMSKHQKQILARTLSARMGLLLRLMGWLLLALAYGWAVYWLGWAFGSVAWFGHLSVAAGCLYVYLVFLTTGEPTSKVPNLKSKLNHLRQSRR